MPNTVLVKMGVMKDVDTSAPTTGTLTAAHSAGGAAEADEYFTHSFFRTPAQHVQEQNNVRFG